LHTTHPEVWYRLVHGTAYYSILRLFSGLSIMQLEFLKGRGAPSKCQASRLTHVCALNTTFKYLFGGVIISFQTFYDGQGSSFDNTLVFS